MLNVNAIPIDSFQQFPIMSEQEHSAYTLQAHTVREAIHSIIINMLQMNVLLLCVSECMSPSMRVAFSAQQHQSA